MGNANGGIPKTQYSEGQTLTAKQEAACLYLVLSHDGNGSTQIEAYKAAYDVAELTADETSHKAASRLFLLPHVTGRVQELRNRYAEAGEITVATIVRKLNKAGKLAKKQGQAGAAVQAVMGVAKVSGLLIDRIRDETEQPDAVAAIKELAGDSIVAQQGLTLLFAGDIAGFETFLQRGGTLLQAVG